jgi:hypothetical protein
LVLAIFADEASADAAADGLDRWAGQEAAAKMLDTRQIQAMGVLVLDESGRLETEKLGPDDSAVAEVDAASMTPPADPSVTTPA